MDSERRARFVAWFEGPPLRGDRDRLMKLTGYTKGRVSQFFDEKQPFGQVAARNLAIKVGLPPDAFERKTAGPAEISGLSAEAIEIARVYDSLPPEERRKMLAVFDAFALAGPH